MTFGQFAPAHCRLSLPKLSEPHFRPRVYPHTFLFVLFFPAHYISALHSSGVDSGLLHPMHMRWGMRLAEDRGRGTGESCMLAVGCLCHSMILPFRLMHVQEVQVQVHLSSFSHVVVPRHNLHAPPYQNPSHALMLLPSVPLYPSRCTYDAMPSRTGWACLCMCICTRGQ